MGPRHKIDRLRNARIVAAGARGGPTPSSIGPATSSCAWSRRPAAALAVAATARRGWKCGPGHVARTRPQLLPGLDPVLDGVVLDATPQLVTALDPGLTGQSV